MNQRLAYIVASLAAVTLSACAQQEGDVCQRYGTAGQSDCAATLECCGEARTCAGIRQRGICVPDGTCPETTPLVCDGDDAGPADAGEVSDAGEDAGAGDAGAGDAGAGDAGAGDAGAGDAGAGDAGAGDAGAGDAGAGDAGAGDAGAGDAGAPADGGAASDGG